MMLMPVKASDLPKETRDRLGITGEARGCTLRCACCGRTFGSYPAAREHDHDYHGGGHVEIQIGLLAK